MAVDHKHENGHRRKVDAGAISIPVNSHDLSDVISPNTLPMRSTFEPGRPVGRPRKHFGDVASTSPTPYKVVRKRASADELLSAVQHSPTVESPPWSGHCGTLKHPAFTSSRRRDDQEE
jgi:hypothetical protein